MAFGIQQIHVQDINPNTPVGIDLPLNGKAVFKPNYQTKDAIRSNLINFFLTNPGERYLNPEFGGGLREFIFEQIESNNIDKLKNNLNSKLVNNFPSIQVFSLDISLNDNNTDNNRIVVSINYSIKHTNMQDTINLQF